MRAIKLIPVLGLLALGLAACKDEKKDTTGTTTPPANTTTTAPATPPAAGQTTAPTTPPATNKPARLSRSAFRAVNLTLEAALILGRADCVLCIGSLKTRQGGQTPCPKT